MAIEEEAHVEATTPANGEPQGTPEPVETTSRSDPALPPEEKKRSKLGQAIKDNFEAAKREPSAARQATAAQRARDDAGKFAPGAKPADPQASASVDAPSPAAPDAAQVLPKDPKSEPVKTPQAPAAAPASLSKETRAIWDSIPEVVRNDILKRETDTAKGVEQLQTRYRPIDEALAPFRPLLQQHGKSEGDAIKQLFDWHQALAHPNPQAKAQAFRLLAQSHGFDLSTLAPQASGQQQQQTDPNDPRAFIQQAVQQALQGYIAPLDQRLSSWEQTAQQERLATVQRDIGEFSKDRPHFDKVRTAMGQMMQAGIATSLEDAYNKAIWADPEIRTEIQATEQQKREADAKAAAEAEKAKAAEAAAEAERKRKEALEKARKAGGASLKAGSPSGSIAPKPTGGKSVKESLAEALREQRRASV